MLSSSLLIQNSLPGVLEAVDLLPLFVPCVAVGGKVFMADCKARRAAFGGGGGVTRRSLVESNESRLSCGYCLALRCRRALRSFSLSIWSSSAEKVGNYCFQHKFKIYPLEKQVLGMNCFDVNSPQFQSSFSTIPAPNPFQKWRPNEESTCEWQKRRHFSNSFQWIFEQRRLPKISWLSYHTQSSLDPSRKATRSFPGDAW